MDKKHLESCVQYNGLIAIEREIATLRAYPHIVWMMNCPNGDWADDDYKTIRMAITTTIGACSNIIEEYGVKYDMSAIKKLNETLNDSYGEEFKKAARNACSMFEIMQASVRRQIDTAYMVLDSAPPVMAAMIDKGV